MKWLPECGDPSCCMCHKVEFPDDYQEVNHYEEYCKEKGIVPYSYDPQLGRELRIGEIREKDSDR